MITNLRSREGQSEVICHIMSLFKPEMAQGNTILVNFLSFLFKVGRFQTILDWHFPSFSKPPDTLEKRNKDVWEKVGLNPGPLTPQLTTFSNH